MLFIKVNYYKRSLVLTRTLWISDEVLIFRYDSHCLKMHVCQSTVMISYYLGKLLWFPPFHFYFFRNYLSTSSLRLLSSSSSVDLPKSQLTSGMVAFFWIAPQDSPASAVLRRSCLLRPLLLVSGCRQSGSLAVFLNGSDGDSGAAEGAPGTHPQLCLMGGDACVLL